MKDNFIKKIENYFSDNADIEKDMVNKPLYQAIIDGTAMYLANKTKSIVAPNLDIKINRSMKNIKDNLYHATNLTNTQEKRSDSWKRARNQLDYIKNMVYTTKKSSNKARLKQCEKLSNHLFKGDDSVMNKLNAYWQNNNTNFTAKDNKDYSKTKKALEEFKEQIRKAIKKLLSLISKLIPGMKT